MKKIFAITLVIIAILSLFTVSNAGQQSQNYTFTIAQAQKAALDNSKQASIDDLDIQQKQDNIQFVRDQGSNKGAGPDYDAVLNTKINSFVKPVQALADLDAAKMTKNDHIRSLKLDIYKAAQDILLSAKEITTLQKKQSFAEEKYKMAQSKYDADAITISDLQNVEYSIKSSQLDVSKAQDKAKSLEYNFKNLLNLPFDDKPIMITDDLASSLFTDTDLDVMVKQAISRSTDIYQKNAIVEAKQKTMDFTTDYFKAGDDTYDINKYDLEMAKLDLNNAVTTLEVNVRNKYNDLLSQQDKLELAEVNVKLTEKNFNTAQTKSDRGLISKEDLLTANANYLDVLLLKDTAAHDYNILKAELQNMIGQ